MDRADLQKRPTQKLCPTDQLQPIITDQVTSNDVNLSHTHFYLKSPNLTVTHNFPEVSSSKFYKLLECLRRSPFFMEIHPN